ncbi:hypothetical protein D3C85_1753280 [compost metagenome]
MKNGVRLLLSVIGYLGGVISPRRLIKSEVKAISAAEKRNEVPMIIAICSLLRCWRECWKS